MTPDVALCGHPAAKPGDMLCPVCRQDAQAKALPLGVYLRDRDDREYARRVRQGRPVEVPTLSAPCRHNWGGPPSACGICADEGWTPGCDPTEYLADSSEGRRLAEAISAGPPACRLCGGAFASPGTVCAGCGAVTDEGRDEAAVAAIKAAREVLRDRQAIAAAMEDTTEEGGRP